MVPVTLPPEIAERVEVLAKASGQSDVVLAAVLDYLDDVEDAAVAQRRLADLAAGRSDTVALADLIARHGLGD